jgi:hypothetical protein
VQSRKELRMGWRSDHTGGQTVWADGGQGNPNPGRSVRQESLMGQAKPHAGGGPGPIYQ